ncbi:hypothetical protein ACFWPX_29630 [Nocardia sp. NPDC058518]|uniref:hypothetical protein n=1 Tax=Nocardia sp. NPDC058518 TaxID=3346534 RepID=UPI00365A8E4D
MKKFAAAILLGAALAGGMATVTAGNALAVEGGWEGEPFPEQGLNPQLEDWDAQQEQQMPADPCISPAGVNVCTTY